MADDGYVPYAGLSAGAADVGYRRGAPGERQYEELPSDH